MKKRILALALTLVMVLGLLAGCSGKKTGEMVTLKVCEVTHSVFYAPQYVAMAQGFFAEEGIALELTNGGGADKVMSAVLSGDQDIGFAGPEAAIYVYNEGKEDYMQIFSQVTQRDGSFLIGREPAPDFKWSDLAGAHILPGRKGGVPYMTFEYVLKDNGYDITKDLLLDNSIQFDIMTSAFTGGTGDYVTAFEPAASNIVKAGQGHIVASIGEASGEIPYTAYFATKSWLANNEETAYAFARALYKGQQWVAQHSAKEIAECIKDSFAETDMDILTSAIESYKSIDAYASNPVMSEEAFNRLQTVMTSAGELEKTAPFADLVNNKYAKAAVK